MWQVTLDRCPHKMPKGRKLSRMNSGDSKAQACSPLTNHTLYKLAVTKHPSMWAHLHTHQSGVGAASLPAVSQIHHLGMDVHAYPPLGVSGATCPIPSTPVADIPPHTMPPQAQRPCVSLPGALYLGQGSHYRTFHNASKEDEVQFGCPCGIGEGSQVVQDLLHGWREGAGSETHKYQLSTGDPNTPKKPCPSYPTSHRRQRLPGSTYFPARHSWDSLNAWGRGPKKGGAISLARSLGPR